MACNVPSSALERLRRPFPRCPTAVSDMACNTLPYKIAALREAHQQAAATDAMAAPGIRQFVRVRRAWHEHAAPPAGCGICAAWQWQDYVRCPAGAVHDLHGQRGRRGGLCGGGDSGTRPASCSMRRRTWSAAAWRRDSGWRRARTTSAGCSRTAKSGSVMADAEIDPSGIVGDIVDAIGHRLAELWDGEVVHPDGGPAGRRNGDRPPIGHLARRFGVPGSHGGPRWNARLMTEIRRRR